MSRTLIRASLSLPLIMTACATSPSTASQPSSAPPASAGPGAAPAAPSPDASVDAATRAAQAWLTLIDQEKYAESWNSAAALFRSHVSEESWANAAAAVRSPLGKLVSRTLQTAAYTTSAPGAPDGKYVVIQFSSTFENKAQGVETVTPMQEDDGSWKVAGYFVR